MAFWEKCHRETFFPEVFAQSWKRAMLGLHAYVMSL